MKFWPVPKSYSKKIPKQGEPGSFGYERDNNVKHSAVDIYAPAGKDVLAIEDGRVIKTGLFTSPKAIDYWNTTYYVMIQNKGGEVTNYAEMRDIKVSEGDEVKPGQVIGKIGTVLNTKKITNKSPKYIQRLKKENHPSMLHFELYKKGTKKPIKVNSWKIGEVKPKQLINPTRYLESLI